MDLFGGEPVEVVLAVHLALLVEALFVKQLPGPNVITKLFKAAIYKCSQ
jgi:hypothetical protein